MESTRFLPKSRTARDADMRHGLEESRSAIVIGVVVHIVVGDGGVVLRRLFSLRFRRNF